MRINSKAYPLPIDNIDTDQIIPAQFLKQVDKEGYGKNLFYSWRYKEDYEKNENFILNDPAYLGAEILIAGNNFGCGSSREHAAWAIGGFGIQAIISTQFADIFQGNAYNNGLLPIKLSKNTVDDLLKTVASDPQTMLQIDLEKQEVTCPSLSLTEKFEIHPFKKQCLMKGMDETAFLINLRSEVQAFEKTLN